MRQTLPIGGVLLVLWLAYPMRVSQSAETQRSVSSAPALAPAAEELADLVALRAKMQPVLARAMRFLADHQQDDGGWAAFGPASDPAVTSLVAQAFIQHPAYGPRHPISRRAIELVLKFRQENGGIYNPQLGFANYTTSVSLMALSSAKDPALEPVIKAAQASLKAGQWIEGKADNEQKPIAPEHAWYGGTGYGSGKRPDLSNTQMMLEALHQSGLPPDDPVYCKALSFIARCQMLASCNDQPFARGANDGGFIYSPANGGESKAGTVEIDGEDGDGEQDKRERQTMWRAYGSMTYAGFKSMLYAKVSRDDPRVQAAYQWIRKHYTLKSNPNMPGQQSHEGLYYFYQVFARALAAWGEPVLVDSSGTPHDWRAELCGELAERQRPDGSWLNEADRWAEDNPFLVTAYSVLAIETALELDR